MFPQFLIPESVIHSAGTGEALELGEARGRLLQLTLGITRTIEQEAIDVLIEGSEDGNAWKPQPLAAFPQKFYVGTAALLLDLGQHPDTRFLRARWLVNRWGRGTPTPEFGLYLAAEPVA